MKRADPTPTHLLACIASVEADWKLGNVTGDKAMQEIGVIIRRWREVTARATASHKPK